MPKPAKSQGEKDLEELDKKLLSTPAKAHVPEGTKPNKPKKRLRRPVNSEADT